MTATTGKMKEPAYIVPALERGLRMLQAFSDGRSVQSLARLGKELDLPRATTFRLADTLEYMGFLVRNEETGEYRIGAAALALGWSYLAGLELPQIAEPFLTRLCREAEASVHLAVLDRTDIVYICRLPSNAVLSSNIRVGSRLPAHASSMGRAILSDLEPVELDSLYRDAVELETFTPATPSTLPDLRSLLARDAAAGGVVISRGYYEKGVVSVAAPIRDVSRRAVAAINITASEGQFSETRLSGAIRDYVTAAARDISEVLGYEPGSAEPADCQFGSGEGTPAMAQNLDSNEGSVWTQG